MPEEVKIPASTARERVLRAFGAQTLRGRFVYVAFFLLLALGGMAWMVDNQVRNVSQDNTARVADRHHVFQVTSALIDSIWQANQALEDYMLVPSVDGRARFNTAVSTIIERSTELTTSQWVRRQESLSAPARQILADSMRLQVEGERLMDVRAMPELTFTAMPIMLNRMQPAAQEFAAITALAIDEAVELRNEPDQHDIALLFHDTQYAWARMIGAFRLYVSNRFGIFQTSTDIAMSTQGIAVEDFAGRVRANLGKLGSFERNQRLQFQQSLSLARMRELHVSWYQAWHQVEAIWSSERWRSDAPLLRDHVQPLITGIWNKVRGIEKSVDTSTAEDLSLFALLTARISDSLWLAALFGLATITLMFVIFEAQIRRPIARVVTALKAEAAGEANVTVPHTALVETRDLIQAFDQMRREVHGRQHRLQAVLDSAAEAIVTTDENGIIESFNPAAEKLFQYAPGEIIGQDVARLMPEPHRSAHPEYMRRYRETGEKRVMGRAREDVAVRKDGSRFPISINVSEMHVDGRRMFTAMMADITERKEMFTQLEQTLERLNAREQRLQTVLNNVAEGIITLDESGTIEGYNHSAEKLFGWQEAEIAGQSFAVLLAADEHEGPDESRELALLAEIRRLIGHEGEVIGRQRDGSCFPMAIKITAMLHKGKRKYIALVSNISERKAMMENLRTLAEHDGLTGLYNRTYFQVELERVVERLHRNETVNCALLYIDLDHFKYVNDTLGHTAGDNLLVEVANILNHRARKSDVVARLGGDEFIVLVHDIEPQQVKQIADSFRRQLAEFQYTFEGHAVSIGCSIGVAVIEPPVQTPAEAMSHADLACHLAKRGGRNQVHVFSPEDVQSVTTMSLDMGWSHRIRTAIEHGRFVLAVQPIVSTRTRAVSTYEVLIRMVDEQGEYIMPGGFLPTAERFGLSGEIDRWVIENAIQTLARLRHLQPGLCYTINLSAQTLNSPLVIDQIRQHLDSSGLEPAALIFEVTETAAIADLGAAAGLLAQLRALGCRTALDDFGSGMSSFAYLRELPVDIVKIDGRFVKQIGSNPVDEAMVRAMNDIAHALGKETIAEFVEDEAAFQKLIEIGVDYAQGYHLGRPEVVSPMCPLTPPAGPASSDRS